MMTENGKTAEPFILFAIGKATYGVHSRLVQHSPTWATFCMTLTPDTVSHS